MGNELFAHWANVLRDMHVNRQHRVIDDFENDYFKLLAETREVFERGDYLAIFGWLQWIFRQPKTPKSFPEFYR